MHCLRLPAIACQLSRRRRGSGQAALAVWQRAILLVLYQHRQRRVEHMCFFFSVALLSALGLF